MRLIARCAAATFLVSAAAVPAHAYLGPAVGLSAIAASLTVLATFLFGFLSILWYPIKRLLRRLRRQCDDRDEEL